MGGFGSGRRKSYRSHETVESCLVLDAIRWMREGVLQQGASRAGTWQWSNPTTGAVVSSIQYQADITDCGPTVRLIYTDVKTGERLNYAVRPQTTALHWGGLRWWFTCPLVVDGKPCGRRAQKLYLPIVGQYFGCRHCYHLAYDSRNEDARARAISKAQRIRVLLGGSASLYEQFPGKPRGMWWRTYRKLRKQSLQAEGKYSALSGPILEQTALRIERIEKREGIVGRGRAEKRPGGKGGGSRFL